MKGLLRLALLALAATLVVVPAASAKTKPAAKHKKIVGAVYTETNSGTANQVIVFDRFADGHLKQREAVPTGGKGGLQPQPGCPVACPFLDTQGEINVSPSRRLVFAVNAGSNTISTFRVTLNGLQRVSVTPSGGVFPNSLTSHGHVLYALNSNSDTIAGFRFSSSGHLTPIAGSVKPLTSNAMPGFPRQIGFDNTGRVLVVTLLGPVPPAAYSPTDSIDTFVLNRRGVPGAARGNNSSTPLPFGFAFSPRDQLVSSQVTSLTAGGDVGSYRVSNGGGVNSIDTQPSQGAAPCWVAITGDGRHVFVVNTGGGAPTGATVSSFKLAGNGKLTFVGVTPQIGEFAKTDEVLSNNSRYLYVLSPGVMANTSHIDEYKVANNGTLTLLGQTPSTLAAGASGLAER